MSFYVPLIADCVSCACLIRFVGQDKILHPISPVFLLTLLAGSVIVASVLDGRYPLDSRATRPSLLISFLASVASMITSLMSLTISLAMTVLLWCNLFCADNVNYSPCGGGGPIVSILMTLVVLGVLLRLRSSTACAIRVAPMLTFAVISDISDVKFRKIRRIWYAVEVLLTMTAFVYVGFKGWSVLRKLCRMWLNGV